jgi:hypothetical protein
MGCQATVPPQDTKVALCLGFLGGCGCQRGRSQLPLNSGLVVRYLGVEMLPLPRYPVGYSATG